MIRIKDKSQCCGCSACADLCPKECISMKADSQGYFYAEADAARCVECGLCERVCPMLGGAKAEPSEAYAGWSRSDEIHTTSTSGGAAYEMGKLILEKGGVLYGCSGQDPYNVCHIRVTDLMGLALTQGSKYVQSATKGIFTQLRKDVKAGKRVMFVGTPCQSSAVRNMFGDHTPDNLLIVDIICHGVPSQKLLSRQLDSMKRKYALSSITSLSFRQSNRDDYSLSITGVKNGKTIKVEEAKVKNPYFKCFWYGLNFRESCYTCRYASIERTGDITIGDFWGFKAEDSLPFSQNKGLSLLLPITEKGISFLGELGASMSFIERPVAEAAAGNAQLRHPVRKTTRVRIYKMLSSFLPDSITSKAVFIDQKLKFGK